MDRGAWWATIHGVAKSQTPYVNQASIVVSCFRLLAMDSFWLFLPLSFIIPYLVAACPICNPIRKSFFYLHAISSVQFRRSAQSCPTLCDPMNHSMPGLPVHHHLLEFIQTHVHRVSDDIQPSHPLSSPSPPAPNPSQHQSLFQ